MKIKNFMKETDKKLKKHSYNAHTIMEELQGNVNVPAEHFSLDDDDLLDSSSLSLKTHLSSFK